MTDQHQSVFLPNSSGCGIGSHMGAGVSANSVGPRVARGSSSVQLVSTWQETHGEQEGLRNVGFSFSWLFLPGANLLCYGMLLAYELGGPKRALVYPIEAFDMTREWGIHVLGI